MQSFIQEIMHNGMIYLTLAGLAFLNIIVPMSGSSTTTPLILTLTGNPQYAIAISSWVLMLNTGIGAIIFRTNIRKEYVWNLLPASLLGVALGTLLLISLPNWLVSVVLLVFSAHFLYKTVRHFFAKQKKESNKPSNSIVGNVATFVSSFLQGTGLSGGGMRVNYLASEGLKVEEIRGTGNLLNFLVFAVAGLVRLADHQISPPEMLRWTLIFLPILVSANYLGRKVLLRLPVKFNDIVIIVMMAWIVGDLLVKTILQLL